MTEPQILEDFENYFLVYKPAGWFVHPPDDKLARKQFKDRIITNWLKNAFPVHRLDFATEGILVWAKSAEAAGVLSKLNREGNFEKYYSCVIRGIMEPKSGFIDYPLKSKNAAEPQNCLTEYETTKTIELPVKINSSFETSRYSLLKVRLHTGRWHQIRRHFNRVSHPIIGDRLHGDSHHNRFFRDELKINDLLLKAYELRFDDPWKKVRVQFTAPQTPNWTQIEKLFDL